MTPEQPFPTLGDDAPIIFPTARETLDDDPHAFDPRDPMPNGKYEEDQDDE